METKTFLMTSSYYPPYHVGGDAVHVKYLSEELVKLGHKVHVMFSLDAYRYKKPNFKGSLNEIEESNGVILHPLQSPLGKLDLYLTYLLGRSSHVKKRFRKLLGEIKPDVVHHHNIFFLGYELLKKQGNYANLYTAHDYWLICQGYDFRQDECRHRNCLSCILLSKKPPQVWRSSKGFGKAVGDIDTIIVPSNYMKKKLAEWLPVKANIVLIPNFAPSPLTNIKDSGYLNYFLFVGRVEKYKGICNLVKIFKKYSKEIDAKLLIVGDGIHKRKIEEYIAKNKLENKIIVFGWVNDRMLLQSLYKDALALILPTTAPENNPLVAIEALSMGTLVIGTNSGGLGELIGKVDKNLIFKGNGLDEIKKVLENKNLHSKDRIKEAYNQWYSPEGYLREYAKIINKFK